jgi:hypothetical protein
MQAIPTTYAGTAFRSRLEASVAAHFDKIELAWEYEPEGFQLSDGQWYLPDFYLPKPKAWLEVKGPHNERIDKLEQFAADLWAESKAKDTYHPDAPIVLIATADERDPRWPQAERHLNLMNVLGPGKRGSAGIARCPLCKTVTPISFFQTFCPACGCAPDAGATFNGWGSWMDYCMTEFVPLRRAGVR